MGKIDIRNNSDTIGQISWESPLTRFRIEPTVSGARLMFPVGVELRGIDDEPWGRPKDEYVRAPESTAGRKLSWGVQDVACNLSLQGPEPLFLAQGRLIGAFHAGNQGHVNSQELAFEFNGEEVAKIESIRDGTDLKLFLDFVGTSFFLVNNGWEWKANYVATPFRFSTGRQVLTIAREPWVDALRKGGVCENILVELPLFREPDEAWAGVWDGLAEARERFRLGMWKDVVIQVRAAFDAWQARYTELEIGWHLPQISGRGSELDQISKEDRLQALLFAAKRFTDRPSHRKGEVWTRDDAVLALTLCTSLWNAIKPHDGQCNRRKARPTAVSALGSPTDIVGS